MNTIARVGKTVLKTLFSKMNIFGELKIDIESTSVTYPKLPDKREVIVSNHSPEMEEGGYKEYQGKVRGCTKRQDRYKIFTWSAVIGLVEIPPEFITKENTLYRMISETHLDLRARGFEMRFRVPTHIVVAKNNKWFKYDDTDGPTLGNILEESESETITIYSIEQVWQQMIWDCIASEEFFKTRSMQS